MNFLINIVGTTAIGKTSLAIALAQYFNTEIISCDSRQFYKEMCIGTAVPSQEELSAVPHHFIQHKSIFDPYSVGDFEREAIALITNLFSKKNIIIMVGGSGLYNDSILKGLDNFPPTREGVREQLNQLYREEGITALQQHLRELDPTYYNKVDLQNPQRIIRALEVCLSSDHPYSYYLQQKIIYRPFTPITIGLRADREAIYDRINQRMEVMLEAGLLQEIECLLPYRHLNALQTVGYREFFDFWEGKISLTEAIENAKMNTRRFAKRQLTWFKKSNDIQWFDYKEDRRNIIDYIERSSEL
ncbi:tRNA (adenosine(37)-N6)-dimethylallyltransferase MiaA [Capnocytophaga sp. G2]|uniref:tRNA (adenosine(37)-N6)-dimethylallyltransferase MiaA n=1 Tax=Capnocytophaga sp. G2 TaxID=3110695 RepID=UPI002B48A6CB|nr:tRNA (adenosine(37)-N6)-dimethylallyltransferase MiaA [Capnocytophaga sp. G2]MEB3004405.1 tRNA (adenosine(37)-N6)-dimethylallyltransferase MiaA [Capnocytophaga sp. G2]